MKTKFGTMVLASAIAMASFHTANSAFADVGPKPIETQVLYTGWNYLFGIDTTFDGGSIKIGSQAFGNGIGLHAPARVRVRLNEKASTLKAKVGVQYREHFTGDGVVFKVIEAGNRSNVLWESSPLTPNDEPVGLSVDVKGLSAVDIIVDHRSKLNYDSVGIADASVVMADGRSLPLSEYVTYGPSDKVQVTQEKGQGYGFLGINMAYLDNKHKLFTDWLAIGTKSYERGLGTHANTVLTVKLAEAAVSLDFDVGVDDEKSDGIDVAVVDKDSGTTLFSSGTIVPNEGPRPVHVDIAGLGTIDIVIDGVRSIKHDKTTLGDARVTLTDGQVVYLDEVCDCFGAPPAHDALTPTEIGDIKVRGEMGRRIDATLENYMLNNIDIDKALRPFVEGEIQADGLKFIGIGMFLDALVKYEQYTDGDPEVVQLKNKIIDTLIAHQGEDGYIGYFHDKGRIRDYWSAHELAYIAKGLANNYRVCGDGKSLNAAKKAADFLIANWGDSVGHWYKTRYLGVPSVMILLYNTTGQEKYLDFVTDTLQIQKWDSTVQHHAYTHLSHCLEHMELYRLNRNKKMLNAIDNVVEFITHGDGMLVTGGVSEYEFWHNSQECCTKSVETCAVAYLLRALNARVCIQPEPLYGDIMERIVFNALKATQSPDCRHMHYHTPAEGPRNYYKLDFYCCPNNLRRIMPEISTMIYYSMNGKPGIVVSQYVASEGEMTLSDGSKVSVEQVTEYPYEDSATISISPEKAATFPVKLRIPKWCSSPVEIRVNGQQVGNASGGGFHEIERLWSAGDKIDLKFPLNWRVIKGRKLQAGTYAILRGPVVYSLNPEDNPATKKLSEQLYSRLVIDPDTLKVAEPKTVDGVEYHTCTVKGWSPGYIYRRGTMDTFPPSNIDLTLTEFAEHDNRMTYFRIQPTSNTVDVIDDELID